MELRGYAAGINRGAVYSADIIISCMFHFGKGFGPKLLSGGAEPSAGRDAPAR